MAQQAAHLLDHALPDAPVRQVVLTLPFELRYLCAYDAEAYFAVRRIYMRRIFNWQERVGKAMGVRQYLLMGAPGAVNVMQRFDSALRLNPQELCPASSTPCSAKGRDG